MILIPLLWTAFWIGSAGYLLWTQRRTPSLWLVSVCVAITAALMVWAGWGAYTFLT